MATTRYGRKLAPRGLGAAAPIVTVRVAGVMKDYGSGKIASVVGMENILCE